MLPSAFFKNFLCRRLVCINAEVCRKTLGGFVKRQIKKVRGKVDHIPMCAAGKTIKVVVCHIQAGMPVIVERTERHTVAVDLHAVPLRCLPAAYAVFDVLKTIHALSSVK